MRSASTGWVSREDYVLSQASKGNEVLVCDFCTTAAPRKEMNALNCPVATKPELKFSRYSYGAWRSLVRRHRWSWLSEGALQCHRTNAAPGDVLFAATLRHSVVATLFSMRYVPSGWLGLPSARIHVWSALPLHVHVMMAAPSCTLELPPATPMQRRLPSVL